MYQQRTSLAHLWDSVKPDGVYFIEDLATSYMTDYGGAVSVANGPKPNTFMEDLKSILDSVNDIGGQDHYPKQPPFAKQVVNFEFVPNLVALTKMGGSYDTTGIFAQTNFDS